jgi:hypothetical protein
MKVISDLEVFMTIYILRQPGTRYDLENTLESIAHSGSVLDITLHAS